ncbi:DsrE family protein [Hydrotalea sp.]|uniref:DsrE family protein n=1 Tax=Hydrotalea sp. TaxID=2881279 RepID=UPI00262270C2|nr:DsrE family protein [Hydrotalea sp.]
MKNLFLFLVMLTGLSFGHVKAQITPENFTGAKATLNHYNALYILDDKDNKKIRGTLRNINNALEDPRLKGKITIELIAFGDGVEVYKKTNPYDSLLTALQKKGVILAQCSNTIRERHISKDELWPYISYVPSGNGEIIIRQYQGWATVHP